MSVINMNIICFIIILVSTNLFFLVTAVDGYTLCALTLISIVLIICVTVLLLKFRDGIILLICFYMVMKSTDKRPIYIHNEKNVYQHKGDNNGNIANQTGKVAQTIKNFTVNKQQPKRISNRQSIGTITGDVVQVAAQPGNENQQNYNQSINTEQQNPQRKPKMSKPSSGKKEKEELPQESHAIQLLSQIYDMTKSLLNYTREVIKRLDQNEETSKNSTEECASSALRDLRSSRKATNPEYTAFLEKQAEIYDELGHLQRYLQYEFSVRVVTPLSGWLQADFARINAEMERMYEKKTEYGLVTAEIARNPRDAGLLLQQDLCRQEYQGQMEITKLELSQLSGNQNEHAKILNQFALTWKEYAASARRLLDQLDSTPSKMTGPG